MSVRVIGGPYKPTRHNLPYIGTWDWLRRHTVAVWPFWERGAKQIYSLAGQLSSADIIGATWEDQINGPALHFAGAGSVNTGRGRFGSVGLFAASTEQWTLVVRSRVILNNTGIAVSRAGSGTAATRQLNVTFAGDGLQTPGINVRGSSTATIWGLDDGTYHTIWVVWDGLAAIAYYDNAQGAISLTVGTAVEETTENVMFGARLASAPTGFLIGDVNFAAILDIPLSTHEIVRWNQDLFAPWRSGRRKVGMAVSYGAVESGTFVDGASETQMQTGSKILTTTLTGGATFIPA